ncbi:hypothetical protein ASPCAL14855 [Aspergillus calidoustus]|uniref:NAD-dependent epimerase/dehydratase domain-containing protein n=1 Tax=Aspergillus calidoustus TaxID=454130 RepID=A0A0U5GLN3_ASPCI|nr:hypothetical protein ASPCAL14855 [Aspergillus calidoustus]
MDHSQHGVTGYIGGDVFYALHQAHPDWEYSLLICNKDKGAQVAKKYPSARIVYGDLDLLDIIEKEVKNANIIYPIAKGLAHHTPRNPVWLIHTSGTGILTIEDFRTNTFGLYRTKEHNDWEGVDELVNLPADSLHRKVDEIIFAAGPANPTSVHTAIICPPTIYGPNRGPSNTKSVQAYWLAAAVLKRRKGLLIGEGKNIWHQVHVQDLSDVYCLLGDAAAAGGEVEPLSDAQVMEMDHFALYALGTCSRGHSLRARKLLGWSPSKPSLMELIPSIVDLEAKALGLA